MARTSSQTTAVRNLTARQITKIGEQMIAWGPQFVAYGNLQQTGGGTTGARNTGATNKGGRRTTTNKARTAGVGS